MLDDGSLRKIKEINFKLSLRENLHEVRAQDLKFENFYQS
jgi:hypothetical protein